MSTAATTQISERPTRAWRITLSSQIALAILGLVLAAAIIEPLVSAHPFDAVDWTRISAGPSLADGRWLGCDTLGRDVLTRTLTAIRLSLAVAFAAALVSLLIGLVYGAIAALGGGWIDDLLMRVVDGIYAVPLMFLAILLMVLFGSSVWLVFVAIAATQWLTVARVARGQTLAILSANYVAAARLSGMPWRWILARHVLPNLAVPAAACLAISVPDAVLIESFLSFIGLGVQEPMTSLGALVAQGSREFYTAPWLLIGPGAAISLIILCLNLLCDGARRLLAGED